jgi:hypothetical protein
MSVELRIEGKVVSGEIALAIAPGTKAAAQRRALDGVLAIPLAAAAEKLGAVVAASPSAFVTQEPGKDAEGRTRFRVRGRVEGDRLLPARPARG